MGPLVLAAAMGGMSLMQSFQQDKQAKVNNITAKSNAKVANILRSADNTLAAARDNLARYQQAVSNKYKLIQTGETRDAQATNLLRMADDMVRGTFESRIASAEQAGALAAAAGAAGVGGGSLAIVDQTNKLREARAEQQREVIFAQQTEDAELELAQTYRAGILGLDDVAFQTSLNYMETQPQLTPRVNWGQALLKAGMAGFQAYSSMGGGSPAAPAAGLQQSVAGPGLQQSAAVSTSPLGARPSPTLRLK